MGVVAYGFSITRLDGGMVGLELFEDVLVRVGVLTMIFNPLTNLVEDKVAVEIGLFESNLESFGGDIDDLELAGNVGSVLSEGVVAFGLLFEELELAGFVLRFDGSKVKGVDEFFVVVDVDDIRFVLVEGELVFKDNGLRVWLGGSEGF